MGNRLYVGNLAYSTMDQQLQEAFSEFGEVTSASVVIDRATGQSRGFGFVEYGSNEEAERAIQSLNGATLDGRSITVNVARERRPSAGGGGGGGGGGGRRFGGDGGGRPSGPPRGGGGGGGLERLFSPARGRHRARLLCRRDYDRGRLPDLFDHYPGRGAG